MLNNIKLSIIIPAYNSEDYILECLNSITNQNLVNYECIIVDDGSTDNTGNLCDDFVKSNSNFKIIHQNNSGVSASRNTGISFSTGDYITFVDSDDLIAPNAYKNALNTIIENNCEIYCFGIAKYHNSTITKYPMVKTNLQKMFIKYPVYMNSVCNKIFNINLLKNNQISFNTNIKTKEDFLFSFKALSLANKIIFTNNADYLYRYNSQSVTHNYATSTTKKYRHDEESLLIEDLKYFLQKNTITSNTILNYFTLLFALHYILDYSSFNINKYKQYVPRINIWIYSYSIKFFLITLALSFHLYFFIYIFHFLQGLKRKLIR